MSTKEKSYTFRAQADLGTRARAAYRTWAELVARGDANSSNALRDAMASFYLSVGRRAHELGSRENQSELFRTTFELFVESIERALSDREAIRAYEEWAREDHEGAAMRDGALAAAADRWRED